MLIILLHFADLFLFVFCLIKADTFKHWFKIFKNGGTWLARLVESATDCYLVIKRNEVLIYATTWINHKNITLGK